MNTAMNWLSLVKEKITLDEPETLEIMELTQNIVIKYGMPSGEELLYFSVTIDIGQASQNPELVVAATEKLMRQAKSVTKAFLIPNTE